MNLLFVCRKMLRASIPWLLVLFFWTNIWRKMNHSALPFIIILVFLGILGILDSIVNGKLNKRIVFLFYTVYLSTGFLNWCLIGNVSLGDLAKDLLLCGVLFELFVSPIHYFHGFVSFYVSVLLFIDAFLSGDVAHELLSGASGNYISVFLILSESIYYMGLYNSRRTIMVWDLLPVVLCLMLSIWAVGRSGIICSTLFLFLMVYSFMKQRWNNKHLSILLCIVILLSIVYLSWDSLGILENNDYLRKLEEQGLETSRYSMWQAYWNQMVSSPSFFLFGVPFEQVPIIQMFDNNTHNSFIQLHALNGMLAFILLFYFVCYALVFYFKHGRSVLFAVLLVYVIRGMTDKFIFGEFGMPVLLYFTMLPFVYLEDSKIQIQKKL